MSTISTIGLGVAGNFTGHLEQAGEAADFTAVKAARGAPKGIFPWHMPIVGSFLATWPVSATHIAHPGGALEIQTEPEVGLLCDVHYADDGSVSGLHPVQMAAWNDCSIRRPPRPKISLKKNWGAGSKGLSAARIDIDGLAPGGVADRFRLACFLLRDGEWHDYGEDSAVAGYSYFHQTLLDWLVDRMNHQTDVGPLEPIAAMIEAAGRPQQAWISIGATRYTAYGEGNMLRVGDVSVVVVYDGARFGADEVRRRVANGDVEAAGLSVLRQVVQEV